MGATSDVRPGSVVRRAHVGPILRGLVTAKPSAAAIVLDVGGYDGAVSVGAGTRPTVVVDLDFIGPVRARDRGSLGVQASGADLPVVAGIVDVALCLDVLPCVPVELASSVYREISRTLRPGGRLVITEVDEDFKLPFVDNDLAFARWGVKTGGLTYERLLELLDGSGLVVAEYRRFYGLITRFAYTVMFFWNVPRRGFRLKMRAWWAIARVERVWCPAPQAHMVVARLKAGQ